MPKQRTGGMTTIGVLNIVLGGFGIIFALFGILAALEGIRRGLVIEGFMGIPGISAEQREIMLKMLEFALFALVGNTVGVIAGIGILRMAAWARVVSLVYAGLWVLQDGILLLLPVQADGSASDTIIGRLVGACLGFSYLIILFILFKRPNWKDAFAKQATA